MKHHREPRPHATGLPATYIEAEEALIIRTVRKWWELKGDDLSAESCHADFEAGFFDALTHPENVESAALIVQVAKFGHPAADVALRRFIAAAVEGDRFQQLPVSVRDYAREGIRKAPLAAGYPPRTPKTADHYGRDIAVCFCIDRVRARYPAVPPYMRKKGRRSAADMVGEVSGMGERQAARIHETTGTLAIKLAEFFLWPVGIENGDPLAWLEKR